MKRAIILFSFFIVFIQIGLCFSPDSTLILEFPKLPKTNYYYATGKHSIPMCSIYLPKNIESTKKISAILWIDGGFGGAGDCVKHLKEKVGDENYILINFPLFKASIDSLKQDSSNQWTRFRIRNSDSEVIWHAYQIMLDSVFSRFPQIDPTNAFMGGFSNGAHCTAVLLNRPEAEITHYFSKFFFVEGGDGLTDYNVLRNRPVLFLQGTELSYPNWVQSFYINAKNSNAKAIFIFMKGAGHNFPKSYFAKFQKWIRKNS
ncbi:MAG: hypothetical protein PHV20_05615 [Bacteroidales bacterium]|nr:hypothetical protein [Bacteroidales bacterium]